MAGKIAICCRSHDGDATDPLKLIRPVASHSYGSKVFPANNFWHERGNDRIFFGSKFEKTKNFPVEGCKIQKNPARKLEKCRHDPQDLVATVVNHKVWPWTWIRNRVLFFGCDIFRAGKFWEQMNFNWVGGRTMFSLAEFPVPCSPPLRQPCPQVGRGRMRFRRNYLHARTSTSLSFPVQVIRHHRNRGMPTRWGRSPQERLLLESHRRSCPLQINFSDVKLKNAHSGLRTADLSLR